MGEDASLDEFLGGASEESDAETTEQETDAPEEADATVSERSTDALEPAKTTYAWSDEGTTCPACGEVVERRWQQDGGLVCADCKDWDRA
jgi:hypothetical protein